MRRESEAPLCQTPESPGLSRCVPSSPVAQCFPVSHAPVNFPIPKHSPYCILMVDNGDAFPSLVFWKLYYTYNFRMVQDIKANPIFVAAIV